MHLRGERHERLRAGMLATRLHAIAGSERSSYGERKLLPETVGAKRNDRNQRAGERLTAHRFRFLGERLISTVNHARSTADMRARELRWRRPDGAPGGVRQLKRFIRAWAQYRASPTSAEYSENSMDEFFTR